MVTRLWFEELATHDISSIKTFVVPQLKMGHAFESTAQDVVVVIWGCPGIWWDSRAQGWGCSGEGRWYRPACVHDWLIEQVLDVSVIFCTWWVKTAPQSSPELKCFNVVHNPSSHVLLCLPQTSTPPAHTKTHALQNAHEPQWLNSNIVYTFLI